MASDIQVTDNKREVERAVEKAMKKAARMIGGTVVGHAVELAPRDTGLLANSITFALGGEAPEKTDYASDGEGKNGEKVEQTTGHYDGEAPDDDDHQITVYVGTNVEYAPYQELGAPNINLNPRPFLRPAMEDFKDEIERILEDCLRDID